MDDSVAVLRARWTPALTDAAIRFRLQKSTRRL
jgi:hypothetical protein